MDKDDIHDMEYIDNLDEELEILRIEERIKDPQIEDDISFICYTYIFWMRS